VLMNAGAGLVVAGRAETLEDAIPLAVQAIDGGKALAVLTRLAEISQEQA
jgi:anthranilate phosphoribosyltransferase